MIRTTYEEVIYYFALLRQHEMVNVVAASSRSAKFCMDEGSPFRGIDTELEELYLAHLEPGTARLKRLI